MPLDHSALSSDENSLPPLAFSSVRATMFWRWRSRDSWGFKEPRRIDLPSDPSVLIAELKKSSGSAGLLLGSSRSDPASEQVSGGETISDKDLAELAIQTWRLQNRINGLDPEEHKRIRKQLTDSVRRFTKILERFEVEYEDVTGRSYSPGWQEVEVVSWEAPDDGEAPPVASGPWVQSTVSPIVRKQGRAVKLGQIVCVDVRE